MTDEHSGSDPVGPLDPLLNQSDAGFEDVLRETLGTRQAAAAGSLDVEAAWQRSQNHSGAQRVRLPAVAAVVLLTVALAGVGYRQLNNDPGISVASQGEPTVSVPEPTGTPTSATDAVPALDLPQAGRCSTATFSASDTVGTAGWVSTNCMKWGAETNADVPPLMIRDERAGSFDQVIADFERGKLSQIQRRERLLVDAQEARRITTVDYAGRTTITVFIDMVDHSLAIIGQSDDRAPEQTADAVRAGLDDLLSSIELRSENCGIPKGYEGRDFDRDGISEYFGPYENSDGSSTSRLYTVTADAAGCGARLAATGTTNFSAGSPAGWGCLGAGFVDWQTISSTQLTLDGAQRDIFLIQEISTTTFSASVPATAVAYHLAGQHTLFSVDSCSDHGRTGPDAIPESSGATGQTFGRSRAEPSCENEHWAVDLPDGEGWFTHAAGQPLRAWGEGADRRCTYFTKKSWKFELQCDCVPAVEIDLDLDAVLDQSATDVVRADIEIDSYPARVRWQDSVDDALFGTNYTYEIDVGLGVLSIRASDAEFDDFDAAIALADAIAAEIEIKNVAPRDRPCAAAPAGGPRGDVLYHDLDGDGVSEAIVPGELVDPATANPSMTHRVLRSDGACGWNEVGGQAALVQDAARSWFCNGDGLLVTADLIDNELANEVAWQFNGSQLVPAAANIPTGAPAGCNRPAPA